MVLHTTLSHAFSGAGQSAVTLHGTAVQLPPVVALHSMRVPSSEHTNAPGVAHPGTMHVIPMLG